MQYSPSEYATLLKYNPILPYSAFTMDIINNAYLDMNEQGMHEDKYFALSNYDNIYDRTNNNNRNSNSNTNLSSEEQSISNMAESSSMKQGDNPTVSTNNSNNSILPKSNNSSKNSNF